MRFSLEIRFLLSTALLLVASRTAHKARSRFARARRSSRRARLFAWASSSPISPWASWARTDSSSPSAARIVPSHSDTAPLSGNSKRASVVAGIGFASLDVRSAEGEKFARALEVTTTSEVFLFDRARTLRYRGAIDDQYGIGYSKPAPTKSYLADAIDGLLSTEAIAVEATTAPGCVLSLSARRFRRASPTTTG